MEESKAWEERDREIKERPDPRYHKLTTCAAQKEPQIKDATNVIPGCQDLLQVGCLTWPHGTGFNIIQVHE